MAADAAQNIAVVVMLGYQSWLGMLFVKESLGGDRLSSDSTNPSDSVGFRIRHDRYLREGNRRM